MKTCQVRSWWEQVALLLPCRKPTTWETSIVWQTPVCAPFKISVHSVFRDFSCFLTTVFTVQNHWALFRINVHCVHVLSACDLCVVCDFHGRDVLGCTSNCCTTKYILPLDTIPPSSWWTTDTMQCVQCKLCKGRVQKPKPQQIPLRGYPPPGP